jgi:ribonuclease HII
VFSIIICGGDEAGRGAVIGPLVVSIVVVSKANERQLTEIGVRDSKLLSREKRELLFDKISKIALEVHYDCISPGDINNAMGKGISLNELEAVRFSKLFERTQNHSSTLYLDSPDVVAEKFGLRVNMYSAKPTRVQGIRSERKKGISYTRIIAEHKADSTYPVVSAASIIAKVTRDNQMKQLEKELDVVIGSGYPSDSKTIAAIKANIKQPEFKQHLREYWMTVEGIKQTRMTAFTEDSIETEVIS